MAKILTFTDGSSYAPSVYDHSAWAARCLEASIQVIHTLNPHHETAARADFSGNFGFDAHESLLDEMVAFDRQRSQLSQKKGQAILADAAKRLEGNQVRAFTTEQRHGLFVDVLEDLQDQAELIVIGKRGKNNSISMKHLGTNIERTLRAAGSPVLVASRDFKDIESFLLAYDGGPASKKALNYITSSRLLTQLKGYVVTVGNGKEDREHLDFATAQLEKAGFPVESVLREGSPSKIITEVLESQGIDLLVMGAYGHSKYKRLLIGSTTSALVRDCHVPVLMFR